MDIFRRGVDADAQVLFIFSAVTRSVKREIAEKGWNVQDVAAPAGWEKGV